MSVDKYKNQQLQKPGENILFPFVNVPECVTVGLYKLIKSIS